MKRPRLVQNDLLKRIIALLRAEPAPCYITGGYVRDWLLGWAGKDVDFTVAEKAIPLTRRIANATGGAFYVLDEEMDAARIVYREPEFVVDLAGLRGADIQADLRARDFTVNAMAVDVRDCGGPTRRSSTPAQGGVTWWWTSCARPTRVPFGRIQCGCLRAVRFEVTLSLQVEPETESWLRRDAPLLARPAAERIRQELVPIVAAPGAADHLRRLDELGLLGVILPEMVALKGVAQPPDHHVYDVYEHTLATVAEVERLHGVPETRFTPEEEPFWGRLPLTWRPILRSSL